jgi:hypothetical protein
LDAKPKIKKRIRKTTLHVRSEIRKLQENPLLGVYRVHTALLRMGIEVSRNRTRSGSLWLITMRGNRIALVFRRRCAEPGGCTGVPGDDEDNDAIMDTEAF